MPQQYDPSQVPNRYDTPTNGRGRGWPNISPPNEDGLSLGTGPLQVPSNWQRYGDPQYRPPVAQRPRQRPGIRQRPGPTDIPPRLFGSGGLQLGPGPLQLPPGWSPETHDPPYGAYQQNPLQSYLYKILGRMFGVF